MITDVALEGLKEQVFPVWLHVKPGASVERVEASVRAVLTERDRGGFRATILVPWLEPTRCGPHYVVSPEVPTFIVHDEDAVAFSALVVALVVWCVANGVEDGDDIERAAALLSEWEMCGTADPHIWSPPAGWDQGGRTTGFHPRTEADLKRISHLVAECAYHDNQGGRSYTVRDLLIDLHFGLEGVEPRMATACRVSWELAELDTPRHIANREAGKVLGLPACDVPGLELRVALLECARKWEFESRSRYVQAIGRMCDMAMEDCRTQADTRLSGALEAWLGEHPLTVFADMWAQGVFSRLSSQPIKEIEAQRQQEAPGAADPGSTLSADQRSEPGGAAVAESTLPMDQRAEPQARILQPVSSERSCNGCPCLFLSHDLDAQGLCSVCRGLRKSSREAAEKVSCAWRAVWRQHGANPTANRVREISGIPEATVYKWFERNKQRLGAMKRARDVPESILALAPVWEERFAEELRRIRDYVKPSP